MNRIVVFGAAAFFAIAAVAMMGNENTAVAGHGCHGCDGGHQHGCFLRRRGCGHHHQPACCEPEPCCEPDPCCGGGEAVIHEVPVEAAPVHDAGPTPAAPDAPAAPAVDPAPAAPAAPAADAPAAPAADAPVTPAADAAAPPAARLVAPVRVRFVRFRR